MFGREIGRMYDKTHQMEPLLPSGAVVLEDMARTIVERSATLACALHPISLRPVVELLRLINSYCSNLIEGHSTHPVAIEQAMRQVYATDPAKRDLQLESLAHIECQRMIDERLRAEPEKGTRRQRWGTRFLPAPLSYRRQAGLR